MYWHMLFMAHLFIGLVFGCILNEIYHNKNIIVFCAIGSVLPDLVNKIPGNIFLSSTMFNAARFYVQSLALFLLFFLAGLLIWKVYHSNSFLCVAVGIILHKIADMWMLPEWYFPLSDPYRAVLGQGSLQNMILLEITSVTEWIFFIGIIGITVYLITQKSPGNQDVEPERKKELISGILGIVVLVFVLFVSSISILPQATALWQ